MKTTPRAAAMAAGLTRYFTGKPCPSGHVAERAAKTGGCVECLASATSAWRASNKARLASYNRDYRSMNLDAITRRQSSQRTGIADQLRDAARRYASVHKAERARRQRDRHAAKLKATPPWFGELDDLVMDECASLVDLRRRLLGGDWHVDHMIPLRAQRAHGLHCATNVQVIPAPMNLWKKNRMVLTEPGQWIGLL